MRNDANLLLGFAAREVLINLTSSSHARTTYLHSSLPGQYGYTNRADRRSLSRVAILAPRPSIVTRCVGEFGDQDGRLFGLNNIESLHCLLPQARLSSGWFNAGSRLLDCQCWIAPCTASYARHRRRGCPSMCVSSCNSRTEAFNPD
jgi:hypothetical protein